MGKARGLPGAMGKAGLAEMTDQLPVQPA